ncbi:MAG: O-antigen ligase family protein [Acidimicrobiales bacterium]
MSGRKTLRRVWVIWALLFFNVLSYAKQPTVIPIPHKIGQVLTQGALVAAFVLALSINPKIRIRPNLFLALYSALAILSLAMSIRLVGIGTDYRAFRMVGFVLVLWMLTPWWGRRDLLLLKCQVRFLVLILITIALGLVLSPGKALAVNFGAKRLTGAVWPIPPTQVAHYMAELAGLTILMWMCGLITRRRALWLAIPAAVGLLATQTRTALLALVVGLIVAIVSLLKTSRRSRRVLTWTGVVILVVALPLSPLVNAWLVRGQNSSELNNLSGRTLVWPLVLSESRPDTNKIFGSGLSNGSLVDSSPGVNGLPIDSSWILTYQDQGLVGVVLEAVIFLVLLTIALLRPRSPARAIALFLIVYCLCASFTESGMGEASTYLLDLTVAASLLVSAPTRRKRLASPELPGTFVAATTASN